jgi:hypothetical protein
MLKKLYIAFTTFCTVILLLLLWSSNVEQPKSAEIDAEFNQACRKLKQVSNGVGNVQNRLETIADCLGVFGARIGEIKDASAATIRGIAAEQRRIEDNLQIIEDCERIIESSQK